MTQIKNIKKLYTFKGKNISEICRKAGYNYRTIVKYLEKSDFNEKIDKSGDENRGRPRKIDFVSDIIDKWLLEDKSAPLKQRHTAKRIFLRLQEEHSDLLAIGYRSISKYVSEKKKEIYKENRGYIPLEHPPGEAQVDFGKALFYENDKSQMLSLPKIPFVIGRIVNVKANKYGKVEFETNIYSTSPLYWNVSSP